MTRHVLSVLTASLLAGCFNPDDIRVISGAIATPTGVVEPQAPISLRRGAQAPCVLDAGVMSTIPSSDGGDFAFEVIEGLMLPPDGGTDVCFSVSAEPAGTGGSSIYFSGEGNDVELPAMVAWSDSLPVSTTDGGWLLTHGLLPVTPGVHPPADGGTDGSASGGANTDGGVVPAPDVQAYEWEFRVGDLPLWAEPLVDSTETFDSIVLEDFPTATAGVHVVGLGLAGPFGPFSNPTPFVSEFRSRPVVVTNENPRVPASRGAPCACVLCPTQAPCPFTDGRLDPFVIFDASPDDTQSIQISIPSTTLRTVVIRDLITAPPLILAGSQLVPAPGTYPGDVLVLGSNDDGETWPTLATLPARTTDHEHNLYQPGQFLIGAVDPSVGPVSQVTVVFYATLPDGSTTRVQMQSLSEISLF